MYSHFLKYFFDFVFALVAIICLSPLFVLLIVLCRIINGKSGVFFLQKRAGINGKEMSIIKFKSMTDKRDKQGILLPDAKRIKKFGKFLRLTSLDEIPQLFNVILLQMSVVGPRPLLPEYTKLYDPVQRKRLNVRPGITGWAQVHGRNSLKLSARFEMDVFYVDHISMWFDIKILYLTVVNLFTSKVVVDRAKLVGVDDLDFDRRAFENKGN